MLSSFSCPPLLSPASAFPPHAAAPHNPASALFFAAEAWGISALFPPYPGGHSALQLVSAIHTSLWSTDLTVNRTFPPPGILHILLKPLRLSSHIPPHLVFNTLRRHKIAHKRPNYIGKYPRGPSQQLLSQARILPLRHTPPSLYHNISWRFSSSATTSAQSKAFLPPDQGPL